MQTQYSRLLYPPAPGLPDPLLRLLQQREPAALSELARRYNRKLTNRTQHLTLPQEGDTYDTCDLTLLALVWSLVQDRDALDALARRLGFPIPTSPHPTAMCQELLGELWHRGRDGDALEELWRRQGLLPVVGINAQTPENVLGFLFWHHGQKDACEELLRRYGVYDIQRCSDDAREYARAEAILLERFHFRRVPAPFQSARELASVVADKILHLVRIWDYVQFSTLENLLVKAICNYRRDAVRPQRRRATSLSDDEADDLPDPRRSAPSASAEWQDDLRNRLSLEERIIRKVQNGFPLREEELTWTARRNLEMQDQWNPGEDDLAQEAVAVAVWLADHPSPSGAELSTRFLWYRPAQFGKTTRAHRLRVLQDAVEKDLRELLDGAPDPQGFIAEFLQPMQELQKRASTGNRPGRGRRPGTVSCFRIFTEAGDRLVDTLCRSSLSRRETDILERLKSNLAEFAAHFPILIKLSACRGLAGYLVNHSNGQFVGPLTQLTSWLEEGQKWLASFSEADKKRASTHEEALKPLTHVSSPNSPTEAKLLCLLLASTQEPGPASPRLSALYRVWQRLATLGKDERMGEIVEQAHAGAWHRVAEVAGRWLTDLRAQPLGDPAWQDVARSLKILLGRRPRPIRVEACKRLCLYLKDLGTVEAAHWEARLALDPARDSSEYEAVWRAVDQTRAQLEEAGLFARGAALGLLSLWIKPSGMSDFSDRALGDLNRLWWLTHDTWYSWPGETAPCVERMIAMAVRGDWESLSAAASRLLGTSSDLSGVARSLVEEFRESLQRLVRRRGRKRRQGVS